MRWTVIEGDFEIRGAQSVFKGAETPFTDNQGRQQTGNAVGLVMNDQRFAGGEISATIEFSVISETNACELVFYFNPAPVDRVCRSGRTATRLLHSTLGWPVASAREHRQKNQSCFKKAVRSNLEVSRQSSLPISRWS